MRWSGAWLVFLGLLRAHSASAETEPHGIDVTVEPTAGILALHARRTQTYQSEERGALLDVEMTETLLCYGLHARAGYKIVVSKRFALTPLLHTTYARTQPKNSYYSTESFKYQTSISPRTFSLLVGAEALLLSQTLGIMLGVGGSSIKVTSTVASRSGYTILVGARYRWPTESAWSPSFGLGVEFINPLPT
jgi:hypothetical protein